MAMSVLGGASLASEEENGGSAQIFPDEAQPQMHELPVLMPSMSSWGPALLSADAVFGKQEVEGRSRKRPASADTQLKSQAKKANVCRDIFADPE